jgi:hypothetical protein
MHGLPSDTNVGFLYSATLTQVCVGENETILNLHPGISIMIASSVGMHRQGQPERTFDEPRELGQALFSLLGAVVTDISIVSPGTLRMTWSTGDTTDILDSWKDYESYTVKNGDNIIVV